MTIGGAEMQAKASGSISFRSDIPSSISSRQRDHLDKRGLKTAIQRKLEKFPLLVFGPSQCANAVRQRLPAPSQMISTW